ncbi:MAG: peptidoglycan bridge formation glycyltransferase FemA/FemB family protein, partial [Bacilli bacterium]|nr:peptidoglycan bridge formation glycyltransferase FemA/FemB family protein [Bacilli bacterium]
TLLLEKKLPMNYSYFYAPRGFVIDYKKYEILRVMINKIVEFAKSKKAVFIKIDPDLIKTSFNYNNEENKNSDFETIFNNLKECKWKHLGFTKNFETMQPRYTFRIDLNQSMEEIESHFSKTTKQRITKAKKLDTEVVIGTSKDLKEFYHLMTLTENRKDFISYNEDYYETLYEIFNGNKNSKATLFLGKVIFNKTIKSLESSLKTINNQISILPIDNLSKSAKIKLQELTKQKENILKDIEKYKEYKKEYGNEITLSAHMIIEYGDKAWVLYAGNHNILTETYVNYNTYYEHIKYAKEKGLKIYDQFGTIGDLSENNPRLGLHEFKKKFGGDYVEFIGEWDYIIKPFTYFVFTKLVPLYRKMIRKKSKKELKHEISQSNNKGI